MKTRSFFTRFVLNCCRNVAKQDKKKVSKAGQGMMVVVALASLVINAQDDSMSQLQLPSPGTDSIVTGDMQQASGDSVTNVVEDAPKDTMVPVEDVAVPTTARLRNIDLVNITVKNKKIRAMGWGEYVVGGHCLCCDNMKSIDCVTVQTRNRTDKLRIKQVVDGRIPRDTSDRGTYFGNVYERENDTKPVAVLMADITWPKMKDIYKVIVYTVADSLKQKNVPFNCELAYYDQFDRLRWLKKVENCGHDEQIVFDLEKPVLTKNILLKIRDGRSKLTEVAIFGEASTK